MIIRIFFALFVGLILPNIASAQELNGNLTCIVFVQGEGLPLTGAIVSIDGGASATTNADGAARLQAPQGKRQINISHPDYEPASVADAWIVAGETTEIIASLGPAGVPAVVSVEYPRDKVKMLETTGIAAPVKSDAVMVRVRGKVVKDEDGAPVADARIFARGSAAETKTDENGLFELDVPEGKYALSIIHSDFNTQTIDGVLHPGDEAEPIEVGLTPSALALRDYTVTAPRVEGSLSAMLDQRKKMNAVSDVIGAEQISRSGDSDAAAALKRVTGLTVVDGKYIYVRGMGERYSSSLINGSTLPSPEPERRVVPLDMFPTDLFQGVVVQKTYSPDMPGEFGGGVIMLQTKGVPDEFVLKVGMSGGYHVGTTFERGLMYDGGDTDWLGIDDGSRAMPDEVARATEGEALLESDRFSSRGYTSEELEEYGEAMPNNWEVYRDKVPMDAGLDLTAGYGFRAGVMKIGLMGGLTYGNDWDLQRKQKNYYIVGAGDHLELQHSYDFETLTNSIDLGTIFNFGLGITDDHLIQSTTLLVRTTDNETRMYHGPNRDVATNIEATRQRWLERQLFFQQASGHHIIPEVMNLGVDWRYAFSKAERDEPDRREVRYDLESTTGEWILSDRPEGNQRLFSELEDENNDFGLDLTLPFNVWRDWEAKVKTGAAYVTRERNVDTRRFKFMHKGERSTDVDVLSRNPEDIFVDENIGSDGFQFEEITRETDNYNASQDINAFYGIADLPVMQTVRVVGGARWEKSAQNVETFELFNPDDEPVAADLETTDILPALNVTYNFNENMFFRGAYSKTVSRPDFRELSSATFNDVTGGRQVFGNPDLERCMISSMDLRWEWYFAQEEILSFGLFYKQFEKPIETIVVPSAQFSVTYENAKKAENYGLEMDFRKSFGFVYDPLEYLYLSGNAAWIQSEVELSEDSGISTEDKRPLQGQSPYTVNLMLEYDNEDIGAKASILYNVFGERIEEVGAGGAPDVVEQPFHQLDLVASQALPHGFSIKAKAKNLLDLEVRRMQDEEIVERYFKGREFSLGLSWQY